MSDIYVKTNDESALELFNKRLIYEHDTEVMSPDNVINMNLNEKILYGRINKVFIPITVVKANLKEVSSKAESNSQLKAIDVVADLFEEMSLQFRKAMLLGKINTNDPYLSELKAYKAFSDPLVEFRNYEELYYNSIAGLMKTRGDNIHNFNDMMLSLLRIMRNVAQSQPITFTGFVKSRFCSVMSTGLAIEIADADYIDDANKIENFYGSGNWNYFLQACNSYGFIVDSNVPWRIILDIGSDEVIQTINDKYRDVKNVETVLNSYFQNASELNYSFFKQSMLDLYNTVATPFSTVRTCADGSIVRDTFTPESITLEQLVEKYSEEYFIESYIKLRVYEEAPSTSPELCDRIVHKQINMFRNTGNLRYLYDFFESELNKTFDKHNSFSYAVQADAQRDSEMSTSEDSRINTPTESLNDFSSY